MATGTKVSIQNIACQPCGNAGRQLVVLSRLISSLTMSRSQSKAPARYSAQIPGLTASQRIAIFVNACGDSSTCPMVLTTKASSAVSQ